MPVLPLAPPWFTTHLIVGRWSEPSSPASASRLLPCRRALMRTLRAGLTGRAPWGSFVVRGGSQAIE